MSIDRTIFSALVGLLVGASAPVGTAWITQRTLNRRELVRAEMQKREMFYGQFISECAKLVMDAFTHTLDKPEILLPP